MVVYISIDFWNYIIQSIKAHPIAVGTQTDRGESPESSSQDSMQLQHNAANVAVQSSH